MIGAIDIGGTKIAVGLVSESGAVLARLDTPTDPASEPASAAARMSELLRQCVTQTGDTLDGIGIGCTGPVDPLTGELGRIEFMPNWEGFNLAKALAAPFGVMVAMENDADAAALGEAAWGAGQGASRFIYITVSTGIGGGVVLDGHLYRGVEGAHPEMGHHVIDPSGPQCFCGAHGCWESLASGPALAARSGYASAREACEAALQGNPKALASVREVGQYLGLGLANLVTLFAPDVIALGGGVMQSRELFWDIIRKTMQEVCGLVSHEKTKLVPAALGNDAGLVGAARAWMHRFGSI